MTIGSLRGKLTTSAVGTFWQVAALKAARQQLYDKLLSADSSEGAKYERRLSEEIARIQAEASSHIDRIRKESTEMFERETRMLRELRDTAQQEASSQASNTKALQTQYDDLLLKHRDLQKRADLKQTELQVKGAPCATQLPGAESAARSFSEFQGGVLGNLAGGGQGA